MRFCLPCVDIVLLFILLINANEGVHRSAYIIGIENRFCVATNVYGITIPRFSNAVSVMLLIYWTTTERAIESEV